jgi:hypothetical protein
LALALLTHYLWIFWLENPGCITERRPGLYKTLTTPRDIPYEQCPQIEVWRRRQLEDP